MFAYTEYLGCSMRVYKIKNVDVFSFTEICEVLIMFLERMGAAKANAPGKVGL